MPKHNLTPAPKKRPMFGGKSLPTGQEIYDLLMVKIEPELVFRNLQKLDAPYTKETPAKRKTRYARYKKALKEYQKQYKAWTLKLNNAIKAYKRAVVQASEKNTKKKEDAALADLEEQMNAA